MTTKYLIQFIGIEMIIILGNMASFLIIWYCAKKDIKEYLNGKK